MQPIKLRSSRLLVLHIVLNGNNLTGNNSSLMKYTIILRELWSQDTNNKSLVPQELILMLFAFRLKIMLLVLIKEFNNTVHFLIIRDNPEEEKYFVDDIGDNCNCNKMRDCRKGDNSSWFDFRQCLSSLLKRWNDDDQAPYVCRRA